MWSSTSVQFSHSVVSDPLGPHRLQHARPPCPLPTPGVYSNSSPLSQWCHPTISSSVVPFSSCLQSFPAAAAAAKSPQSYLTLCDPIDGTPRGFSVPGILQAGTLEWVAISFSDSILKSRDINLPTRVQIVKAMIFFSSHVWMWDLDYKKAECQIIDAFELRCWRRLSRVTWNATRFNKSILKEINPEYSLEGLMLKLNLQ